MTAIGEADPAVGMKEQNQDC